MTGFELFAVVVLGALGVAFLAMGSFLIVKGLQARAEVTQTLLDEHATTPSGEGRPGGRPAPVEDDPVRPEFDPGMPVQPIHDAKTARTRIAEIKYRTTDAVGSYQSLAIDDSRRQWFLNGLTIRAALGLAVMGYGVANIAMALGASLVLLGAASLAVGIPVVLTAID